MVVDIFFCIVNALSQPNTRTLANGYGAERVSLFPFTVLQASAGVFLICSGSQLYVFEGEVKFRPTFMFL